MRVFAPNRTVTPPEVVELIVREAKIVSSDKVLEIGTGSGEGTEILARTGAEIHTIELEPYVELTKDMGGAVYLHSGDGLLGLEQEAPFTVIVATCGVEKIPLAWINQLAEAGRLVAPVGNVDCQKLTLFTKTMYELIPQRILAYVRFLMAKKPIGNQITKPVYKENSYASGI